MLGVSVRGGGWCVVVLVGVLWPAACGIPRNSLSLVAPDGTRTSWWTRGSTGSWQPQNVWNPLSQLPLKVRITAKLKPPNKRNHHHHHADTYTTGGATSNKTGNATDSVIAVGGDKAPCSTCGTSIINGNRGHNQVGWLPHKGNRPPVTVWPWSVSKSGRENITTILKGIPNTNSFLIYFGRSSFRHPSPYLNPSRPLY